MSDEPDLETALRACVSELARIAAAMPDLSGLGLAYDRGNVDSSEWESAQAEVTRLRAEEATVAARIEALRVREPEAMVRHVASMVTALSDATPRLPVGERSIVPDLIASLTAWAAQQPSRYPMTWAWRLAYQLVGR